MNSKRIVILANSRKHSGRCVAGKELLSDQTAGWVRPVSDRPGEEISEQERQYQNGADPRVLDVVDVPLRQAKPHACHTENWLIDSDHYWQRVDAFDWVQARGLADDPPTLWKNGFSTARGLNDEIPVEYAAKLPNSICMIYVASLQICVAMGYDKRKVQARFKYRGFSYWLSVTDPVISRTYLAMSNGDYSVGESLLVISLSEPFSKNNGSSYQYKLAATILTRQT